MKFARNDTFAGNCWHNASCFLWIQAVFWQAKTSFSRKLHNLLLEKVFPVILTRDTHFLQLYLRILWLTNHKTKILRCQLVKKGIVTVALLIIFAAVNNFNTSISSKIVGSQLKLIALGIPFVFFVLLLLKQLSSLKWFRRTVRGHS